MRDDNSNVYTFYKIKIFSEHLRLESLKQINCENQASAADLEKEKSDKFCLILCSVGINVLN